MKIELLLLASISLNVVWAISYLSKGKPPEQIPPYIKDSPAADTTANSNGLGAGSGTNAVWRSGSTNIIDWQFLESEDYRKYIVNLRSIGCPEETIRDIIVADVNKLFESRKKAEKKSSDRYEYWKGGNPFGHVFDETKIERRREMVAEKKALLKELLGMEINEKSDIMEGMNPFETMLDFLSANKQSKVIELEQKFTARMLKRTTDRPHRAALDELQVEKNAALLELLGPDDKHEYDLRMSQSAVTLRLQMNDFQPTEEEFRQMFKVKKGYDDQFGPAVMKSSDPPSEKERTDAEKDVEAQLRNILGEGRYKEYRYDKDWARDNLKEVAQEFGIPKETALKVFDLKTVAQEQAQLVRDNTALSDQQRLETLRRIREETEQAVIGTLGKPAADSYLRGGGWIHQLNR